MKIKFKILISIAIRDAFATSEWRKVSVQAADALDGCRRLEGLFYQAINDRLGGGTIECVNIYQDFGPDGVPSAMYAVYARGRGGEWILLEAKLL